MKALNRRHWMRVTIFGVLAVPVLGKQLRAEMERINTLGTGHFSSVQFSRNGKQILTASAGSQMVAQLWDLETGKELRRFAGHTELVWSAVFNSEETMILTGAGRGGEMGVPSGDCTARIWDADTGKEIRQFAGRGDPVGFAEFSRDATRILTMDSSRATLWDAKTGKELFRFTNLITRNPALSPDGSMVLAVPNEHGNYYAQLWDAATGKELRRCEGHIKTLNNVRFSPSGKYVLAASDDATARLWETSTGKLARVFSGHTESVRIAEISIDEKRIVTSSLDGTTRIWNLESGAEIRSFVRDGRTGTAQFNRDGSRLLWIARTFSNTVLCPPLAVLWDANTGRKIRELGPTSHRDRHFLFSPDGKSFFAMLDGTAILASAETGETLREYR
jgi:WD40 repeat protein